jgi:hypothetical protein
MGEYVQRDAQPLLLPFFEAATGVVLYLLPVGTTTMPRHQGLSRSSRLFPWLVPDV